jgi:hypothetical protein
MFSLIPRIFSSGRFGIEKENSVMVSRVIREALEDGVIKPVDHESESRKLARYWPKWA